MVFFCVLVCIRANVHVCVGAFCLRALHMYSHAHGNSKLTSISWESWESLGVWIITTTLMYMFLDSPTFWGPLATNLGVGWLFYILIPCLTLASWLCQGSCYIDCFYVHLPIIFQVFFLVIEKPSEQVGCRRLCRMYQLSFCFLISTPITPTC